MIEFTAQADIQSMEFVLVEVGNNGSFSVKPDRFIKSTTGYRKYVLFFNHPERETAVECGTVELIRKKESMVNIKIHQSSEYLENALSSSPTDRFFFLFTQRLIQQGLLAIEFSKTSP